MIYITGDTHRDFIRLNDLEKEIDSMLIILRDAGINYFLKEKDYALKKYLNAKNIKMFCIQGNHEERPENIARYKETLMFGGKVFIEDEFPNLIFAKNGQVYEIIRDYCGQGEGLKGICPKCKSEDVYMLKGKGFHILGSDIIGIGCHACKKIYGFNDVHYDYNWLREL